MKTTATFGILLLAVATATAAPIAAWDVAGLDLDDGSHAPPYFVNADTTDVYIATACLTLSTNVQPSKSADQYGFRIGSVSNISLTAAIQNGHYMEITLVASNRYAMSLSSIEVLGRSSDAGCSDIALLSTVDGYADDLTIVTLSDVNKYGGLDTDDSGFGGPIDLSNARFSGLRSVRFRLYAWNNSSDQGITYIRSLVGFDLIINGTVAPMPVRGFQFIAR